MTAQSAPCAAGSAGAPTALTRARRAGLLVAEAPPLPFVETAPTTDDLSLATRVTPSGEPGRFGLEVPDGWQQERGAFGGMVLGALARAMEASEPEPERALRSLSAQLLGPVLPGPADVRVEILRRGSSVSSYDARLVQRGELLARASASFGRPRRYDRRWQPPPPEPGAPWGEVPVLDIRPPFGPAFARFFEYRPTGPMIFGGGDEAVASGWLRPRRELPAFGAPELVALADAWWPAVFAVEAKPRPAVTLGYALDLSWDGAPPPGDRPLYYRARAVAAAAGFVVEMRELWTAGGRALAFNQQTFVMV
jgi:hypothetical protein